MEAIGLDLHRYREAKLIVDEQAEDEALWAVPVFKGTQSITEAYLQQELRRLHAAIEGKTPDEMAQLALGKI